MCYLRITCLGMQCNGIYPIIEQEIMIDLSEKENKHGDQLRGISIHPITEQEINRREQHLKIIRKHQLSVIVKWEK